MPPIRRAGRPGVLGLAARTAVVAGTASAVTGGVRANQQQRAQTQQQAEQLEAQQQQAQLEAAAHQAAAQQAAAQLAAAQHVAAQQAAAQQAAPATPPAGEGADVIAQLERLAALHAQGVLSDAEFTAAKAKLLG